MRAIMKLFAVAAAGTLLFAGCSKDENPDGENGVSQLSIRMTDAPANYDSINVEIVGVEIKGSNGATTNLNVNAGVYNLLDFTNGADTLIAVGSITSGTINQVRLILGNNNSIVVDGVSHPLSTPSAQQTGLKLQVHKTFAPGIAYMLLLDFDAHQSIVDQGNGDYSLKPVIRVVETEISGSIKGTINPSGINCVITATAAGNAYSTSTSATGQFLLPAVPPGIYDVVISPPPPLVPVTINGVSVTTGVVTDIGIINI